VIIKNGWRMTERMKPTEKIKTARGEVTAEAWCEMEVERLTAKGCNAKTVRCGEKVYVMRSGSGVCHMPDDDASGAFAMG
jgi:hypothetical protein